MDPVKSGDDAVTKENPCSVVTAPPLVAAGGIPRDIGKPMFPQFLSVGAITIRNFLTRRCFMPIDGLNGKSKASFYDSSSGLLWSA